MPKRYTRLPAAPMRDTWRQPRLGAASSLGCADACENWQRNNGASAFQRLHHLLRRDEQWGMGFGSDSLESGHRIRILTILDLWDRSSPDLEVDISLSGQRVVQVLERLRLRGFLAHRLLTDNGPEFTVRDLNEWAHRHGVGGAQPTRDADR